MIEGAQQLADMNALSTTADLSALPAGARDQRILALCDGAIHRLQEARDVEEVIGLRNAAEAKTVKARQWLRDKRPDLADHVDAAVAEQLAALEVAA
jgi:hypothetical protein